MAVLIELTSLVASAEALDRVTGEADGGARALGADAVASDGVVTALAFRAPAPLRRAVLALGRAGLAVARGEEPGELAVVDQRRGPGGWWPWLELAVVPGPGGGPVLAARRVEREDAGDAGVAVPEGWRFEGSPTELHGVAALRLADRPLRHLRREPDADLYRDRWSGELVRLPRARPPVRLTVEGAGGRGEVLAELATGSSEIEVGLMFRERLAPGAGMLFGFPRPEVHGFWMKNTLVPLDLLFIGDGGRVVNLVERAAPLTASHRWSAGPVRHVLEVPGGWCESHRVGAGARVVTAGG